MSRKCRRTSIKVVSLAEVIIINTTTHHRNLCECPTLSTEKLFSRIHQISFVLTRVSNKIIPFLCTKYSISDLVSCRSWYLYIILTLQITGSLSIKLQKLPTRHMSKWHVSFYLRYGSITITPNYVILNNIQISFCLIMCI